MKLRQFRRDIFCLIARFLLNHKSTIPNDSIAYRVSKKDIEHLSDSSNKMIKTPYGYFRFCDEWRPKNSFIKKSLNYYLQQSSFSEEERLSIKQDCQNDKRFNRLVQLGMPSDKQSFFSRFLRTGRTEEIGITNPYRISDFAYSNFIEKTKELAWYVKDELFNYLKNRRGGYLLYNANRQMGEYAVAKMLGVEHLITKTEFCKLQVEDSIYFGTMSETAAGKFYYEFEELVKNQITGVIQRDLNNLNLLDVINYESDHRPGNYHILISPGGGGIIALDNDSPKAFYISSNCSFPTSAHNSPLIKKNIINRPHFDSKIVEALLSLDYVQVKNTLNPYLNTLQIFICWKRIKQLQKAFKNTIKIRPSFLLENQDWSNSTIEEELNGEYGETYLKALIKRDVDWKINGKRESDKFAT